MDNSTLLLESRPAKRRRQVGVARGRARMHATVTPTASFDEYEEVEPTEELEDEIQLTPCAESAPTTANRPTRGVAERWTDAHDQQLIEIVRQTLKEGKNLNDAWRRGCVEIDRKHDHAASMDKKRPCPACEDRWHRKLKKQVTCSPKDESVVCLPAEESESESESDQSECLSEPLGDSDSYDIVVNTPPDVSCIDKVLEAWGEAREYLLQVDEEHPWNVFLEDHGLYTKADVQETPLDYIDSEISGYDEEVNDGRQVWGQGALSSFVFSLLQLMHYTGNMKDDEYNTHVYEQLRLLSRGESRLQWPADFEDSFTARLIEKKSPEKWIETVRDDFCMSMKHRFSGSFYPKTNLPASSFSRGQKNEIRFYKRMHDALDDAGIFHGSDFDKLAKGVQRSKTQDFYYYPRLDAMYKSIEKGK